MQYVWSHENLLDLRSFFEKKAGFLKSIIENPKTWILHTYLEKDLTLNGQELDAWGSKVFNSMQGFATQLPNLENTIVAFVQGARDTFVNGFLMNSKGGGDIYKMTQAEQDTLFFASTNDINEGALGSWWLGQWRRPAETLHKFNASFTSACNNTEAFMKYKLTEDVDQTYLRQNAQVHNESGLQRQMKSTQMKADEEKVKENPRKETVRQEKQDTWAATILEMGKNLVLSDAEIDGLSVENLNRQLDFHREEEKKLSTFGSNVHKVPLKSHMKNRGERISELKKAIARHVSRVQTLTRIPLQGQTNQDIASVMADPEDVLYESDHNDDFV